jgi:hypothetical protein
LNKREKRLLLPGLESKSLKLRFLEEPTLPIGEGGNSPIKDKIINHKVAVETAYITADENKNMHK